MDYNAAREPFMENVKFVNPPGNDWERIQIWNLNKGLAELATAVEQDLADIRRLLIQIAKNQQR